MKRKSMTALISAFSRAYHSENCKVKIFDDFLARKIITDEEYEMIANSMSDGIKFFNPSFNGTKEDAIAWIVNNQLAPSPLCRAAFAETSLKNAIKTGVKQYLIFASGYDTFAYRNQNNNIQIFEIDRESTFTDKLKRLCRAEIKVPDNLSFINADFNEKNWIDCIKSNKQFNENSLSFCSILGLSYYLTKENFENMLKNISSVISNGSSIVFDYPNDFCDERAKKQEMLANGASEQMKSKYSYNEIEKMLENCGLLIYEHLTQIEMENDYLQEYNLAYPKNRIIPFKNVNYCLAVKNPIC